MSHSESEKSTLDSSARRRRWNLGVLTTLTTPSFVRSRYTLVFLKISLMKAEPPASASFKCSFAVSRIVTFFFGSFATVRPEFGLEPRCLRRWISSLVTWGVSHQIVNLPASKVPTLGSTLS